MSASSGTRRRSPTSRELANKEVLVGATTAGTTMVDFPLLLNDLLGYKFKIVRGYKGTPQINLAIERGEVQGNGGVGFASVKTLTQNWIDEKKIKFLVQYNFQPSSGARRRAAGDGPCEDRRASGRRCGWSVRAHRICAAVLPAARRAGRARARRLRRAFDATHEGPGLPSPRRRSFSSIFRR